MDESFQWSVFGYQLGRGEGIGREGTPSGLWDSATSPAGAGEKVWGEGFEFGDSWGVGGPMEEV